MVPDSFISTTLSNPIPLSFGVHSLAFQSLANLSFSVNTPVVSNSDVVLRFGAVTAFTFGTLRDTGTTWNGTIFYDAAPFNSVPEPSAVLPTGLSVAAAIVAFRRRRHQRLSSRPGRSPGKGKAANTPSSLKP